ncbi:MAG: hypothetical protein LBQ55_00830 [Treponema sp.]|jgi:hypothetical protein|nr:hypothetical protein [Treponema sp.]
MASGEKPAIVTDNSSFEAVLDDAFDRLWDRKVRHSIRRIGELETVLIEMEEDLDRFLLDRDGTG